MKKLLLFSFVMLFTFMTAGCSTSSPQADAVTEKFDRFNAAAEQKNAQIQNELSQYIDGIRCFGNGACSYMIIFNFKQTPQNMEELMKNYTKEYAQLKYETFEFRDKLSATMNLLAITPDGKGLLCKVSSIYMNDFNVACENADPSEYVE
jgi:hypothetical protein